ncbi:MAG: T9SS type A sorting domain-containing protein, partial [candidate division WOR-3 bacterium]
RLIESLPTGRADYAAVVWRDSLIYVLGGFVSEGPPDVVDWVSVYDVYADTWHSATPMPLARWRFDACIIGDTIWSCVDSSILKGVIDADDPLHVTWQTYPGLAGLSTFEQPCVALRGRVVFWGRTTDSAQHQSVWVFDPATWEFDTLPAPPVSTISVCFAVARESAGELYKLAGDDNCDRRPYDATYYKLKVDFPEAVTEQTGSKTATPRQPLGTAVVRGRLLVNPEPASRQVSLHDVTGQKVADLKPGPCDISHLSPGIYFLRLGGSGRERIQKVVIAR